METITFEKETIEAGHLFFAKYVDNFISTEDELVAESLQLKKNHSERVAKLCSLIAEKSFLDKEEQKMAGFIGLWHDIGRFEQFKKYRTFNDLDSENHAELSVSVLDNQEFMLSVADGNKQIIIEAIRHHNLVDLPDKLDKQTLLFCQILRDADKLDIWETNVDNLKRDGSFNISSLGFGLPKSNQINESVIKRITQQKSVLKGDLKSLDDYKLFLISMVFDLNFKSSFHLLNEKQLIRKIYESMSKKDEVYEAYRQVKLYIENKFVI